MCQSSDSVIQLVRRCREVMEQEASNPKDSSYEDSDDSQGLPQQRQKRKCACCSPSSG